VVNSPGSSAISTPHSLVIRWDRALGFQSGICGKSYLAPGKLRQGVRPSD
jgi:hypothetical protein